MTESNFPDLPEGIDSTRENELWNVLGEVEHEQPSARMRQEFYENLEQASQSGMVSKLRNFLGFSGNTGWLTAAACMLVGVGAGQMVGSIVSVDEGARFAALEQNVSMLNRNLILDRLQNDQPGKRLRGVMDAAYLVEQDPDIANTLLSLAANDRVDSIRSAAVESLGAQIKSPAIGVQLMGMLQNSESPLVQLALVDLVLRNGSDEQISQLLKLANEELLFPDLQRHVLTSLKREVT